ncbi:MAG: glycosyltransferase family 2 protein [Oscillospiraceae bacterium]|jgi:dolichol-phosphate mannosyltransferase|nr:glycosyltransferase family 2 protein [Oscillospiraceae bacterium]
MLSIIIPAYNEEENIRKTAGVLSSILTAEKLDYELIFVDDGSTDGTWREILMLSAEEDSAAAGSPIKGMRFSRNFGKEGAIFAGLRRAGGEAAVIIDCDLQHPPELIPEMVKFHRQGFEVVEAVKRTRGKEGLLYKLFAKLFYSAMKANSDIDLDKASDFKLLDRKVINALLDMPERLTFFRALSSWVGFNRTRLEFNVQKREKGKTKWSFRKLVKFALSNLTGFTYFPMQLMTFLSVIFMIFALGISVNTLVQYFHGVSAEGFTTVIILVLITGSVIMFGLGILGYYISKIYEEIKFRPRFIITQEAGFEENEQ